jgi:curved DNA-binding protein CbpA
MGTLYQVLGLPRGANQQQVKAAFRSLARRFHPDVNAGDETAVQRFKEVNSAYETLANPEARAAYDRALVCRQKDSRRRLGSLAATATATFALTAGTVSLAVWWSRHSGAPQSLQSQKPSVESTSDTRAQQGMPYGKGGEDGRSPGGRFIAGSKQRIELDHLPEYALRFRTQVPRRRVHVRRGASQ